MKESGQQGFASGKQQQNDRCDKESCLARPKESNDQPDVSGQRNKEKSSLSAGSQNERDYEETETCSSERTRRRPNRDREKENEQNRRGNVTHVHRQPDVNQKQNSGG